MAPTDWLALSIVGLSLGTLIAIAIVGIPLAGSLSRKLRRTP